MNDRFIRIACVLMTLLFPLPSALAGEFAGMPLSGSGYAFAVYNEEHLLTHSPIETLEAELARTEQPARNGAAGSVQPETGPDGRCPGSRPISDVYVISHGWNFTLEESFRLYQDYLVGFQRFVKDQRSEDPEFNPFIILLAWSSVARPLTSATSAIVPYQFPPLLGEPVRWVDTIAFHLPSNWGESHHAMRLALGSAERWAAAPESGAGNAAECEYDRRIEEGVRQNPERDFKGWDIPASVLLEKLMRMRDERAAAGMPSFSIHGVGHSFGGKLISLACHDAAIRRTAGAGAPPVRTIDSMVLIEPAMKVTEMMYPPPGERFGEAAAILAAKSIRRKAILYSRHDGANGWIFKLSQVVLNHDGVAQSEYLGVTRKARRANADLDNLVSMSPRSADAEKPEGRDSGVAGVPLFALKLGYGVVFSTLANARNIAVEPIVSFNRFLDGLSNDSDLRSSLLDLSAIPLAPLAAQRSLGQRGLIREYGYPGLAKGASNAPWFGPEMADYLNRHHPIGEAKALDGSARAKAAEWSDREEFYNVDFSGVYNGNIASRGPVLGRALNLICPAYAHGDLRRRGVAAGVPKRDRTFNMIYNITRRLPGTTNP